MSVTNEVGPVYGVPLIDSLPLGSMRQACPSRSDLESAGKRHMRLAAAYEVLLACYQRLKDLYEPEAGDGQTECVRDRGADAGNVKPSTRVRSVPA